LSLGLLIRARIPFLVQYNFGLAETKLANLQELTDVYFELSGIRTV
jgi:hypothetical protein